MLLSRGSGRCGLLRAAHKTWNDWEATLEHYPIPKVDGGRKAVDNAVFTHRLCNKLDHFIRNGLSIEKELARVRKAPKEATEP